MSFKPKRIIFFLIFILILLLLMVTVHFSWAEPARIIKVGILATGQSEQGKFTLSAYEQLLKEEGFSYRVLSQSDLRNLADGEVKDDLEALIVPEYINTVMTPDAAGAVSTYVKEKGGKVLLALDPAIGPDNQSFYPAPLLADLAGVNYCLPSGDGKVSYYTGYWYFPSKEAGQKWGITPGKLDQDNAFCSYSYGKLKFEHSRAGSIGAKVIAFDKAEGAENIVLSEKKYENGGIVIYANMPLGKYKLNSDDLTARSVLRTFLICYARAPRLVNSPGGKGGVVFNLHVCSNAYLRPLMVMMMQGLFRKDLPFSIHYTAGPDNYRLGDGMGFDAGNNFKGRPVLQILQEYGETGSHGGWIHNFFAQYLQSLPPGKAFQFLAWNFDTLEAVTQKKVLEYSSPAGNHPSWVNAWLEKRGVTAFYYTGDTGSSPTRSRFDNSYISRRMWAFPITPYRKYASLEEMQRGNVPVVEVKQWMENLLDFTVRERTIRMIYTHPSANRYCLDAIQAFERKADVEQREGRLTFAPMSRFAAFLDRYMETGWTIKKHGEQSYLIDLNNPDSLKDITVAVYLGEGSGYYIRGENVQSVFEDGWLYLTISSDEREKHIEVHRI